MQIAAVINRPKNVPAINSVYNHEEKNACVTDRWLIYNRHRKSKNDNPGR